MLLHECNTWNKKDIGKSYVNINKSSNKNLIIVIIEGFCAKRCISLFGLIFKFWQPDLCLHEKHHSIIVFADLRFVFQEIMYAKNSVFPGAEHLWEQILKRLILM